jgi:cell division protein FtsQ
VAAAAILAAVAAVGGGYWAWQERLPQRVAETVRASLVGLTVELGLTVKEVFVVGRLQTPRDELLEALDVERGMPILDIDIQAARERILALPWIGQASIERLLPDTLVLHVIERRPLALWQYMGKLAVIDQSGEVIIRKNVGPFGDLLVVVGEDAPKHAADLVRMLESQPDLMDMVEVAVRVGGRRWNLRMAGNISVRLPEEDTVAAWRRLAEYQHRHGLLSDSITMLDLRLPDRLTVRKAPRPENKSAVGGRET